jgi:hypothetical protein
MRRPASIRGIIDALERHSFERRQVARGGFHRFLSLLLRIAVEGLGMRGISAFLRMRILATSRRSSFFGVD